MSDVLYFCRKIANLAHIRLQIAANRRVFANFETNRHRHEKTYRAKTQKKRGYDVTSRGARLQKDGCRVIFDG